MGEGVGAAGGGLQAAGEVAGDQRGEDIKPKRDNGRKEVEAGGEALRNVGREHNGAYVGVLRGGVEVDLQLAREVVVVAVHGRAGESEEEDMLGGELAANQLGGRVGHLGNSQTRRREPVQRKERESDGPG